MVEGCIVEVLWEVGMEIGDVCDVYVLFCFWIGVVYDYVFQQCRVEIEFFYQFFEYCGGQVIWVDIDQCVFFGEVEW